jgi:hypothetical protein
MPIAITEAITPIAEIKMGGRCGIFLSLESIVMLLLVSPLLTAAIASFDKKLIHLPQNKAP